jgi:hypothetical protein
MRLSIPQIVLIGCIVTTVIWVFAMSLQSGSDEDPPLPAAPTASVPRAWGEEPQMVPAYSSVEESDQPTSAGSGR